MTGPLGAAFVVGLSDKQILSLEELAEEYMIEILTQIGDRYADKMLEQAGLPITAAADDAPPSGGVSPDDFAAIPAEVSAAIGQTIVPLVAEVYMSGAGAIRANMIREANVTLPPVHSIDAVRYLRGMPHVFDTVGQEYWSDIRDQLAEGFKAGEGIPELAARVRGAAGVSSRKATLVARSAVVGAANAGSFDTARASGLEMQKEWLATPDRRTRESHRRTDGQRVDLNAKFHVGGVESEPGEYVGGHEADHPGDISLPPEERYNCRCTQGYVMPRRTSQRAVDAPPRPEVEPALIERPAIETPSVVPARPAPSDSQFWGTDIDPAMKMTVTQLRQLAKDAGMYSLAGLKKARIVEEIRGWERGNGRVILPPMPKTLPAPTGAQLAPGTFTPTWDSPDPMIVRAWGGSWDITLGTADSGPGGYVVSGLRFDNGYVIQHGRVWRIDGTAYLIETPSEILSLSDQAEVLRLVGQMRKVHAEIPAADKYNKGYAWILGRNPKDAYWEREYKIKNFRSAATAGNGTVTIWDRSTLYGDVRLDILRHETGHNVDFLYARPLARGSASAAWGDAVVADTRSWPSKGIKDVHSLTREPITPELDPTKPFPAGVTAYGKSSLDEDFAESYEMYVKGVIGQAEIPGFEGVQTDIFFRDIYPARAQVFDDLFPDVGKAQIADIAARRAASARLYQAPSPTLKATREAARKRHAAAEKAAAANHILANIDELVYKQADVGVFEQELQYALAQKALTKAETDAIRRAVATAEPAKIEAALARVAKKYNLELTGRAGELTTMADMGAIDMRGIGSVWPKAGDQVRIVRRGARWTYDGKTVDLEPMLVRSVTRVELGQMRQAIEDSRRGVADLVAAIRRETDLGPDPAAVIATMADRHNVSLATRQALVKAAGDPAALQRALSAQLRSAGVKAQGVVGRGVKFDPETMTTRGGAAIDQGAKVKIVETGYVTEIDGQVTVLRRAIVEPIEPVITDPKAWLRIKDPIARNRARGLVIDAARGRAELLQELSVLLHDGASARVLTHRINVDAQRLGINATIRDRLLSSVSAGDLRAALDEVARDSGLVPAALPGDVVRLDRKAYDLIGATADEDSIVMIIRPAYVFDPGDGPITIRGMAIKASDKQQRDFLARTGELVTAKVTKAAKAAKAAKAVKPPAGPSSVKTVRAGDFRGLTKIGESTGSNPGGIYRAADGSKWFIKQADEAWAREQALASKLYREIGVETPEIITGTGVDGLGTHQIAAEYIEGLTDDSKWLEREKFRATVRRDFAADAWLADWDIGQDGNIMGLQPFASAMFRLPVRVDIGGSLRFRARGGPKGDAFGDSVSEWVTMRDTRNISGYLFQNMSLKELEESVARVLAVSDDKIRRLVRQFGLEPKLANTLIARKADLARRLEQERGSLEPKHFDPGDIIARGQGDELATEAFRIKSAFEGKSADPLMSALAKIQGFDRVPEVVSRAELRRRGGVRLYRGLQGTPIKTALEMQEDLRSGPAVFGNGIYGNGYYFTTRRATGVGYSDKEAGSLIEATLRPDARMIDFVDAWEAYKAEIAAMKAKNSLYEDVYGDPGRWAIAHGYDVIVAHYGDPVFGLGIEHPDELYYIVVNRGALIVEAAP